MQKKIIALAIAAAFAAPVAAMADVTVYGVVDGGLRSVTTAGNTSNTMGSGVLNSNRFGIKSSEDLGNGMKANVVLEGDVWTGTGTNSSSYSATAPVTLFSRQSTVGLSGDFGSLDMGHQYTVSFKVNGTIDPFGHKYIGITSANADSGVNTATGRPSATRNDNDFSYTGKFGDVTVMADHSLGGNNNGSGYGSTTAAGVVYASGAVNVGASYSKIKPTAPTATADNDTTHMQIGAGFNFGDGKVTVGYSNQTNANTNVAGAYTSGTDTKVANMWGGVTFGVSSKIDVGLAYYKSTLSTTAANVNDVNSANTVGSVTYALSKKTAMYVEADKQTVDGGADSNGYSLGMSVAF